MIFLEMSRETGHGGGSWAFPNCVWAPTRKENGARWPFWEKILAIQRGDTVIHLRGVPPRAEFVGYSVASADGFETSKRPPDPGQWSWSLKFFKADLVEFTPFHRAINLNDVLASRRMELEEYVDSNGLNSEKRNIFLVRQSGRLQCLNGAYLSEIDENLFEALFEASAGDQVNEHTYGSITIETGVQLATVRQRLGQSEFSKRIKQLYGYQCCFPNCPVTDVRFLVASHIARWSDNESLRGNLGNGLCLCLVHDKAFELGLFTLDQNRRVFVNPRESVAPTGIVKQLLASHGDSIRRAEVDLLDDALLEHWIRVDIDP